MSALRGDVQDGRERERERERERTNGTPAPWSPLF